MISLHNSAGSLMTTKELDNEMPKYSTKDNVHKRLMMLRADSDIRQASKEGEGKVNKKGTDAILYSYAYYSDEQATDLACKVGARYGLLIIPTERNVTAKDQLTVKATVKISAINVDEPVDQIHVIGYGEGSDNMPEAKALTYAGRRAMCVILGLGTSEADPERPQTEQDKKKDFFAKARNLDKVDPPIHPKTKTENVATAPVNIVSEEPVKAEVKTASQPTSNPTSKADIVAPPTTTTAVMQQASAPAPPVQKKESPFKSAPEYRGILRGHAMKLYSDGRMSEAAAREVDANLRKATTVEECQSIAQYIQDHDVDHEAI